MNEAAAPKGAITEEQRRALLSSAQLARLHAYAPYSNFPVGAALLDRAGRVFTGTNVENASYGLSTCAERSALVRAVGAGSRSFVAIAIAGPDDRLPCPPCGSCRQILFEFAPELEVVMPALGGTQCVSLRDLLPAAFESRILDREAER